MFRGLNAISMDIKGRLAVPARYRDLINNESEGLVVATINAEERCLWLYSFPQWQEIETKLISLPSFQPASRRLQRLLIGHATELEMDRNGRILLPPLLREYAGLDKNIMMVGLGNKFELWGESQWRLAREGWLAQDTDETGHVPGELCSISL